MNLKTVDKLWLLGSMVIALVAFHFAANDVSHLGVVPWNLLLVISCVTVFWFKLKTTGLLRINELLSMVMVVAIVALLTFSLANLRIQAKSKMISGSPSVVDGIIIRSSEIMSRGYSSKVAGLYIEYGYEVEGKKYIETVGVADTPENRDSYRPGKSVEIRYARTNPSVSEIVTKYTRTEP